ncbi:MAG: hypothetical protein FJ320_08695 [SAR202 cluster bacterium]|nr:hypothetical protein [SAR202 cluster bacterium]
MFHYAQGGDGLMDAATDFVVAEAGKTGPYISLSCYYDSSGSPAPVVGTTVTFTVIAGPHTGTTGTGVTNGSGQASFTHTGTAAGTDTIEATFVDSAGRTQRSNRVTKTWEEAPLVEICGHGIDNDRDGLIDEYCPVAKGRMTGGGSIGDSPAKHGFQLNCNASDTSNNLEVNWGKGNKFHLESLTSAACSDDPAIGPENPKAGFDTYKGSGKGRYNGVSGATAEWVFTDAGEPGSDDTMEIMIKDKNGNVVLVVAGKLGGGNHQAHNS